MTFYRCVGGNTNPVKPLDTSHLESIRYPQIRAQLIPVLKKTERFDFEQAKRQVISFLQIEMNPTEREQAFIDSFDRGEYLPELLFDDADMLHRIVHHPMAEWKTRNV